ncbi:MAG: hypothetical protein Q9195_004552 [Heterodermia aff. obscurata]
MRLDLFPLLLAGLGVCSALSLQARGDSRKRAAYILSNNPEGNQVLALSISTVDGTVSKPVLTPTGGNGLLGLTVDGPAGPDGLFSQGAVVVSQDYLFTVNPGSRTLSMFKINPLAPLSPQLIGEPCDTIGDFPMSVAYSSKLKIACVVNGGAKAGVSCFHTHHAKGLTPFGKLRPFHQEFRQSTPPTGPPLTTSDIDFNPSSTALFVTIKGDAMVTPPKPGYIYAWPIHAGAVSTKPVVSSPPTLLMGFSIDFLGCDTSALITDPAFGASIVSIDYPSLEVTEKHHIVVASEKAACWGAYAPRFNSAYIIDSGHTNISVVDPTSGTPKGIIQYEPQAKGGFDTAIDRTWMYILTGDSGVAVIDLAGSNHGKQSVQKQHYPLVKQGVAGHWQGMAIYPSS